MSYLKKFGLTAVAIAFLMCLTAVTSEAQWSRNREWRDRDYNRQQDRRWNNRSYRRNGRLTANEYRRLQRQRYRLYRTQQRYYGNDGYISDRERRKLQKRYYKYRRNVYRDRRDW